MAFKAFCDMEWPLVSPKSVKEATGNSEALPHLLIAAGKDFQEKLHKGGQLRPGIELSFISPHIVSHTFQTFSILP